MEIFDLACQLRAEILDYSLVVRSTSFLVRVGRPLGYGLGLALLAWQRKADFDVFYIGNEKLGILVAALLRLVKYRPRIAILNHYLSNSKKALFFKYLQLERSVDALICLNEYQAAFLEKKLAVSPRKIFRVHHGANVDGSFFCPRAKQGTHPKYILSVGRENRDYETLFEVLRNSEIQVKIVASDISRSRRYRSNDLRGRLNNVEIFEDISYPELRELYEHCSFVVLPMHNVDYPAGITAVMEAMAMGKAVVATYSRGIHEFIEDSVTGFWTNPGNAIELREKILILWNNPRLARQMGERARDSVKSRVDLPRYVEELGSILRSLN